MLIRPGKSILPLSEMTSVFFDSDEFESWEVFPMDDIREPVTRRAPSRMTSREGLIVMIVPCV